MQLSNFSGCTSDNTNTVDCCSKTNLCGYMHGHCDSDDECIVGLTCGNCDENSNFPVGTNCCSIPKGENSFAPKKYLGQGHCNEDWECFGNLICGDNSDCDESFDNPSWANCCKQGNSYTYIYYLKTNPKAFGF